jgi:hypothetical protein
MNVTDFHLLVKTQVDSLFSFNEEGLTPYEIDLVANAVANEELTALLNINAAQGRPASGIGLNEQCVDDVLDVLKVITTLVATPIDIRKTSIALPADYLHYVDSNSIILHSLCTSTTLKSSNDQVLELNNWYKTVGECKINDEWKPSDFLFKATTSKFYGEVKKVKIVESLNRHPKLGSTSNLLRSALYGTTRTSPICERKDNSLLIHLDGFKVIGVKLTYLKKLPIMDFSTQTTFAFNEEYMTHLANKTAQKVLAASSYSTEQRLSNLKSNIKQ